MRQSSNTANTRNPRNYVWGARVLDFPGFLVFPVCPNTLRQALTRNGDGSGSRPLARALDLLAERR